VYLRVNVKLGLQDRLEVMSAFADIIRNASTASPDAEITGVLVQKMAPKGHEVILGMTRYPIFGPLLMFGTGGVFVEVFKDVSFRLAPVTRNGAHKMISSVKGSRLLLGYRGEPRGDILAIERMLVALSEMAMNHPEIMELDVNPLLVHPEGKGVTVADCRFILKGCSEMTRVSSYDSLDHL